MNNSIFSQNRDLLYSLLADITNIGIVLSEHQDVDRMAAALSLYLSLQGAHKNPQIVSKKEPIVELSHLVGVDRLKTNFEGDTKTLVLSIPYREGEVEKVSFTTDAGRMNFNIVGGEKGISPFTREDVNVIRQGSAPSLIFTVGVTDISELHGLVESLSNVKIINIDNRATNAMFGDVVLVDPSFSSLSEAVLRIIEDLALPLDVDIAQNLMDGVLAATKNFSSSFTSPLAFEAAAVLMRQGARRKQEEQRDLQSPSQIQFEAPRQGFHTASNMQNAWNPPHPVDDEPAVDSSQTEDVPSDWFVPKVFKGSKKQD